LTTDSVPSSGGFNRIAAIAGLVFVACIIGSMMAVGNMPKAGGAASLADYFSSSTGSHSLGLLIISFAILPAGSFLARAVVSADGALIALWDVSVASTGLMTLAFAGAVASGVFMYRDA